MVTFDDLSILMDLAFCSETLWLNGQSRKNEGL